MANIKRQRIIYLIVLWALYSIPYIVVILLFILLSKGKLGYVPSFKDLENPENSLASEVYTEDGELLGNFFLENRTYVECGKCPDSH
jgi:penicillin-binding protein 1A